jgi:hypothetical protein
LVDEDWLTHRGHPEIEVEWQKDVQNQMPNVKDLAGQDGVFLVLERQRQIDHLVNLGNDGHRRNSNVYLIVEKHLNQSVPCAIYLVSELVVRRMHKHIP